MSTREDREWDERQEYGYSNPLNPWTRASAILADRFAANDPQPVDNPEDYDEEAEEVPVYDAVVDEQNFDPLT